jgi:hypothetical protein
MIEHALVDDALTVENGGIAARCKCGWVSRGHFSSLAASAAFQEHIEELRRDAASYTCPRCGMTNREAIPESCPDDLAEKIDEVVADVKQKELLDALVEAHRQVDSLLAMMIMHDKSFLPTKSPLWPEVERRAKLLEKYAATT